jgi:hypothetical protein
MSDEKQRSRIQEELLSLYLRLNGYFLTGLIIHSPVPGRVSTEVDVLAIRFPHNQQPERQVLPDPLLEPSNERTDLLICEVKSRGQQLRFNEALVDSTATLTSLLQWSGLHSDAEIQDLVPAFRDALSVTVKPNQSIPTVDAPRQSRVRGILCSPERDKRQKGQAWFIPGPPMLSYISQCLCPSTPRSGCATTYDYGLWGKYERLIRYIKDRGYNNPGTIAELYEKFASDDGE